MQKKKGISLIVLVITIIVMIILAAAIVITLNNSGIINKANEAVDRTDEAQLKEIAQVAWAEAYLESRESDEEYDIVENTINKIEARNYEIAEGTGTVTEDSEGNKVAKPVINGVKLEITENGVKVVEIITFYIFGEKYQAEEGMTWLQWTNSSYNTIGVQCTQTTAPWYCLREVEWYTIENYRDEEKLAWVEEGSRQSLDESNDSYTVRGKHKITANVNYVGPIEIDDEEF